MKFRYFALAACAIVFSVLTGCSSAEDNSPHSEHDHSKHSEHDGHAQ